MLNLVFGACGACDQPTYRAARFASAKKIKIKSSKIQKKEKILKAHKKIKKLKAQKIKLKTL